MLLQSESWATPAHLQPAPWENKLYPEILRPPPPNTPSTPPSSQHLFLKLPSSLFLFSHSLLFAFTFPWLLCASFCPHRLPPPYPPTSPPPSPKTIKNKLSLEPHGDHETFTCQPASCRSAGAFRWRSLMFAFRWLSSSAGRLLIAFTCASCKNTINLSFPSSAGRSRTVVLEEILFSLSIKSRSVKQAQRL